MATITFDTLKATEDLEAAGMDTRQAKAVVNTLADAFTDTVATKTDIAELRADVVSVRAEIGKLEASTKADLAEVKTEIKAEIAAVKTDIASVKAELKDKATKTDLAEVKAEVFRALWIQGAGIVGIQLAIAGLLFAAIRFLGQPV